MNLSKHADLGHSSNYGAFKYDITQLGEASGRGGCSLKNAFCVNKGGGGFWVGVEQWR